MYRGGVSPEVAEAFAEKFDAEKISQIVEGAANAGEAFEKLHEAYPEFEVKDLQKQMDFIQGQFEAAYKAQKTDEAVELTEEELDHVSGGGLWDWCKSNWKTIAIGAAIVVGAALICSGVGAGIGAAMTASAANAAANINLAIGFALAIDAEITGTAVAAASVTAGAAAYTGVAAAIGAGIGAIIGNNVACGLAGADII